MVVNLLQNIACLHYFIEFDLGLRQLLQNQTLVPLSVLLQHLGVGCLALQRLDFILLLNDALFVLQRFCLQLRNLFFALHQLRLEGSHLLAELFLVLEDLLQFAPERLDALALLRRQFLVELLYFLVFLVCKMRSDHLRRNLVK